MMPMDAQEERDGARITHLRTGVSVLIHRGDDFAEAIDELNRKVAEFDALYPAKTEGANDGE